MQSITLYFPQDVMLRAKRVADVLQRPLEEVLTTTLASALPDVEDAPADMQAELVRMTWFSDQELWAIANSMMSEEGQKQLADLSDQAQRQLTQDEREKKALRQEYGRTTLRKARAYALLSMRGGRLLLADD